MMILAILFAATLSAGNAEFVATANKGAFDIAAGREKARLVAEGPAKGVLAAEMLSRPGAYGKTNEAKVAAWKFYQKKIDDEYASFCRMTGERLGLTEAEAKLSDKDMEKAKAQFEKRYAEERAEAVAEQAASLVGNVRPSEVEFETKDEDALKKEMSAKIAEQQKTAVFEENLGYISEKIVEPVLKSAKDEQERQRRYLFAENSDAYAPSVMTKDLTDKLVQDVEKRKAKADDPAMAWGVFPSVTNVTLRNAVRQRTMDRVAAKVAEIPFEVKQGDVRNMIESDRAKHRKAGESKNIFRQAWTPVLRESSVAAVQAEAPKAERKELGDYLTQHSSDKIVTKAVNKRIDEEMVPKLDEVRRALADAEFVKTWPTLADRTWWPDAETADKTSARSDFKAAVRAWREMPELGLEKGADAIEESAAQADKSVAAAFEIARGAVAAQTKIVDEVCPAVLGDAKDRKDSLWRRTPDLKKAVAMLTEAVEELWDETKVGTLWPKGDAPKNADEQHAELFPSVKERIELKARSIVEEINKPKDLTMERRTKDSTEESREGERMQDDSAPSYSIVVSSEGGRVTVKFTHGDETLGTESGRAQMGEFLDALRKIGEQYGKEALNLK